MSRIHPVLIAAAVSLTAMSATAAFVPAVAAGMTSGMASGNPMVGGAPMYPTRNIVENAVNSRDHTTLVAAVKAAGLVGTLSSPGPFTVFAPVNAAFHRLPAGAVANLLKPENKGALTGVLTYHVVPGKLSAMALREQVRAGGGRATLRTAQGGALTVTLVGRRLAVTDAKGGRAMISIADVNQSNGVIHVVDSVLMP